MALEWNIQKCPLLQELRHDWQGRVTWYPTTEPLRGGREGRREGEREREKERERERERG